MLGPDPRRDRLHLRAGAGGRAGRHRPRAASPTRACSAGALRASAPRSPPPAWPRRPAWPCPTRSATASPCSRCGCARRPGAGLWGLRAGLDGGDRDRGPARGVRRGRRSSRCSSRCSAADATRVARHVGHAYVWNTAGRRSRARWPAASACCRCSPRRAAGARPRCCSPRSRWPRLLAAPERPWPAIALSRAGAGRSSPAPLLVPPGPTAAWRHSGIGVGRIVTVGPGPLRGANGYQAWLSDSRRFVALGEGRRREQRRPAGRQRPGLRGQRQDRRQRAQRRADAGDGRPARRAAAPGRRRARSSSAWGRAAPRDGWRTCRAWSAPTWSSWSRRSSTSRACARPSTGTLWTTPASTSRSATRARCS